MTKGLQIGLTGEARTRVGEKNIASSGYKQGPIPVFATPAMVALMEKASLRAVEDVLSPGRIAVGSMVQVRHFRATPPGMEVVATAKLVEVAGTRLIFQVEAFNEKEKIGAGIHERVIVSTGEFIASAGSEAAPPDGDQAGQKQQEPGSC